MSDLHLKISGAWKAIDNASVKVSGAWKQVEKIYVKVSGAWKEVWINATVNLSGTSGTPISDTDVVLTPATATAGWTFSSSGDLTRVSGSAYNSSEWYGSQGTHQTPDQTYYIRATYHSGLVPDSGPTLGNWHSLATTRTWYWQTSSGIRDGALKIEISSDASGSPIVATGYYDAYAESTP